jgi:hypothetical protein
MHLTMSMEKLTKLEMRMTTNGHDKSSEKSTARGKRMRNCGFAGSSFHIPSSTISILHPKICDLHDHHTHRDPNYLISPIFIPTDRS